MNHFGLIKLFFSIKTLPSQYNFSFPITSQFKDEKCDDYTLFGAGMFCSIPGHKAKFEIRMKNFLLDLRQYEEMKYGNQIFEIDDQILDTNYRILNINNQILKINRQILNIRINEPKSHLFQIENKIFQIPSAIQNQLSQSLINIVPQQVAKRPNHNTRPIQKCNSFYPIQNRSTANQFIPCTLR